MIITLDDGRVFPTLNMQVLSWSIGLYMTHAEADIGYPKAKAVIAAMKRYRPQQLEHERIEMLKGSFDPMFGHNARNCLALIEA